ncbi:hypothetical protein NDU88_007294 [Pleurodeles waltl]|uniref:Uncharacterized protein n=1 Tax=Pleurodeles waltl TaxID=8319 RepID=A0AAV7MIQ8_PLEWA|nr:hypothetical protein NDU88_007294 [Pleurodeles waltl]
MDRRSLYVMGQYQRPSARLLFCAWTGGRSISVDSTNASQHGYSSVHGQEAAVCNGTVPTPLSTAPLLRMDRRSLYAMGQYQRLSARLLFCAWTGGCSMSWDSINAPQHGHPSVHGQEGAVCHRTVSTPLSTATLLCMDRRPQYVMGQYQRLSARLLFCAWTGGRCMPWDSTNASQHGYSSAHGQEVAVCQWTVPTPLSTATLLRMDRRALYVMGQYQRLSARLLFCAWTGGRCMSWDCPSAHGQEGAVCHGTVSTPLSTANLLRMDRRPLDAMGQYQRLSARLLFCAWTGGRCMSWDSTISSQHGQPSAHGPEAAVCNGTVPTPLSTATLLRMDRRPLYVMGPYQRLSARLLFCAWTGGRCMPWDSTNVSQHGYPSVHGQEAAVCQWDSTNAPQLGYSSVHGQEGCCMSSDSINASQHGSSSVHGQEGAVCHGTVPTPLSTATLLCMDRRHLYVMGQYQRLSARLLFCAWTGGPVCNGTVPTPLSMATLLCMDRRPLYFMGQYQRLSARLLFCAWTGGRCMSWDSINASQHGHPFAHGQEVAVCHGTVPTPLSTATLLCINRRALYVMGQYPRLSARLLFCAWTGGRCMSWDSTNAPQHGYSSAHGPEAAVCNGTVSTPLIRATLLCMDRRALYAMGQYQRLSARPPFCAWTGGRCMSWDSPNASQHGYSVHGQEAAVCNGTVPTPLSTATLCMDRRAPVCHGTVPTPLSTATLCMDRRAPVCRGTVSTPLSTAVSQRELS